MVYSLLQAVFLQLLVSPVAYILGRKVGPTPAMWFTFAILLYTTILVINAALSGTVGLGNIAGVAVAVSLGGPGATLWMIFAGFFAMAAKFVECSLG